MGEDSVTPAELLKHKLKGSWDQFSDEELYKVFCLLVEQIEGLEQQNKALKKDILQLKQQCERAYFPEIEQIEKLKTHAKRDALKIINQTEKISNVIITQAVEDVERVAKETEYFEMKQQEVRDELIDFLQLKVEDVKKYFNKIS